MNKNIMTFFAIGTILLLGAGAVFAYQGSNTTHGPNYSADRHDTMEKAFDTMDYNLWVETMNENSNNPRVLDIVTKENFNTFVLAHEAMEAGNLDKAKELRESIGLSMKQGMGQHKGQGQMRGDGNCKNN